MTGGSPVAASWKRRFSGWPAAGFILAAFWLLMLASLREKSVTTDEIVHVTAGYSYWRFNDYRQPPAADHGAAAAGRSVSLSRA